jgi:hypothetical protein
MSHGGELHRTEQCRTEAAVTVAVTASYLEAVRCLDGSEGDEAGSSDCPERVTGKLCVEAVVSLVPVLGGYSGVAEGSVMLWMKRG